MKIKQNPKEAAREQLGLNNQRRAWGESDETKQLDNRGIYQLNQQKIDGKLIFNKKIEIVSHTKSRSRERLETIIKNSGENNQCRGSNWRGN